MTERPRKRGYQPKVEALEALRLLDAATPAILANVPTPALVDASPPPNDAAWSAIHAAAIDAYLDAAPASASVDLEAVASGLNQLERYLARTWTRAGIPRQANDDCTQAVFTTLLEQLGRTRFDSTMVEISQRGVPQILSRETATGPDFLRAVDMIKKRALREKHYLPIDEHSEIAGANRNPNEADIWHASIQEAIQQSLNPREAELIRETLRGLSPSEIASQWGVAPKTVSNEKTRAFAKLREALEHDWVN
jgi:RNA polymerase sigma factor (sigma-70 family)